ncbi:MAG: arginase [Moraxellaceae bacterium]|nr:MAG: arginase [Moraxellaceae bacterium]
MGKFIVASREYLNTLITRREGETKLGEHVQTIENEDWEAFLQASSAKFVIVGIPEDIGVRANCGVGGAHTLWEPALKTLLNIQSTKALTGEDILVAGWFDFTKVMERSEKMDVEHLRDLVGYIDETVHPLITKIVAAGKVPIVIGGGHNNAYPLLKGASLVNDKPLNCINLDAHSDFRRMEGRHSGNGFRYAHREGYLKKYAVIGLHENYNAQDIIDEVKDDPDLNFCFYEDIFVREKTSFNEAVRTAIGRVSGRACGVEIDLDCIEGVLSSAMTPAGITSLHARQYISLCAQLLHPTYLHITEGATELRDGRKDATTPKLVSYLVTDFIKGYKIKKAFFN